MSLSPIDKTNPDYQAAAESARIVLDAVNASMGYLYIFSLVAFVAGLGLFLPGRSRWPAGGAAMIFLAMIIVSAPGIINMFFN